MNESVSVVIPAWNAGRFLERAIRSALSQTRKPQRVVVIDDGSEDNTWQIIVDTIGPGHQELSNGARSIVDGIEVIGIKKPHTNVSHTRNTGMDAVWDETTIFAFMDADDWYAPDKIKRSLEAFALHTAIGCVVSDYDQLMPDGRFYREYKPSFDGHRLMAFNPHNTNCLVRREALEKISGPRLFDESLTYCEDYDLFLRLAEVGLIYHIPEVLHHRTEHDENMSRNLDEMFRHERLVKQMMLRRRGLAG